MRMSGWTPRRTTLALPVLALAAAAIATPTAAAARLDLAMGEEMEGAAMPVTGPPAAEYFERPRWKFGGDAQEDAVLEAVHAAGASITYHLRYRRDYGPVPPAYAATNQADALPSLRKLQARGIPWTAWITVPYTDGYWAAESNPERIREAVEAFDAWATAEDVKPAAISIDLESTVQDTAVLGAIGRDPLRAASVVTGNLDPARQCAAARAYRDDVVGWLREEPRGYQVKAAVYPYLLDDLRDGDLALSDALDLPIAFPGEFDELGFMAMRSTYTDLGMPDPGPTLQTSYGRDARLRYGAGRGGLSLGVPGDGPYRNRPGRHDGRDALLYDLRMAATATTGTIGLYSVEKVFRHHGAAGGAPEPALAEGLAAVRAAIAATDRPLTGWAARVAFIPSPNTLIVRGLLRAADAVLGDLTLPLTGQRPTRFAADC